jgi:sugar-specific transcriptional regulator TrmB
MDDDRIRLLQEKLAALQRRLEALESGAIRRAGQQIENGLFTAIEITKKQIAEIKKMIAGLRTP